MKQVYSLAAVRQERNFPPFMAPRCTLPCSQYTATGSYSEPNESSPQLISCFLEIRFNIILPFTPKTPKWKLSFRISDQSGFKEQERQKQERK